MKRLLTLMALCAAPVLAVPPPTPPNPEAAEGVRLFEDGRYELALPLLEEALARLPGDPDILTYVAFAHRRAGRVEAAMDAYRQALARDPAHPAALAYQGGLFLELGRRAEAEGNLAILARTCPFCAERETLERDLARGQ